MLAAARDPGVFAGLAGKAVGLRATVGAGIVPACETNDTTSAMIGTMIASTISSSRRKAGR